MNRHVILVGLPGSGKSTVGRRVAELLPTDFTDLDFEVEREAGRSITAIFERMGEASFRQLERAAMARALAERPRVIAAGAGWIAQPGNLAAAARACVVYLRVTPALAARRLEGDRSRPLLAGDPAGRLAQLFEAREAWYRMAEREIDGDAEVETVALRIVALLGAGG